LEYEEENLLLLIMDEMKILTLEKKRTMALRCAYIILLRCMDLESFVFRLMKMKLKTR
jgi:hypothetical protein